MSKGTAGPLNALFVERLFKKYPERFDTVVIDGCCEDLIPVIKKTGYKGKILEVKPAPELGLLYPHLVDKMIPFSEDLSEKPFLHERVKNAVDELRKS